jgi:hypothetical protein
MNAAAPSRDRPGPRQRRFLLGALLVGGLYLGAYLTRGWYPHDEGALGQTAERVLLGEVPHRDFDEPYTGLLTYLHAVAFAVGGVRLPVLRAPLFLAALFWLGAVYHIARRSTTPLVAALVTLLALVWSVPNYPASMPSWYNLFCATFGVLALLKWREDGARTRWLFAAGVAGGISFLFKLTGLFYVAGVLLYLVFATRTTPAGEETTPGSGRLPTLLISLALLGFVFLLWRAIAPFYQVRPLVHFVLPGAALAGALIFREWQRPVTGTTRRLKALLAAGIPFLAGVALPVLLFAAGYAAAGGLDALVRGVFIAPFRRLAFANMQPPAPFWALAMVPLGILLRPRSDATHSRWRRIGLLTGAVLALVLWLASTDSFPHRVVWQSLRVVIPALALCGAAVISSPRLTSGWTTGAAERFVLLTTLAALTSLVQFPFSAPIYFLYVAPLALLALVALLAGIGNTPPPLAAATMVFYGAFAVLLVTPGATRGMGLRTESAVRTVALQLPRGGLRIYPADAELYEELIPQVRARAGRGEIWAGPDAPEVYFLGGFRNRTRLIFDFFGTDDGAADVIRQVNRFEVKAVVINSRPSFSQPLSGPLHALLRQRFPGSETIGRFELRWRN